MWTFLELRFIPLATDAPKLLPVKKWHQIFILKISFSQKLHFREKKNPHFLFYRAKLWCKCVFSEAKGNEFNSCLLHLSYWLLHLWCPWASQLKSLIFGCLISKRRIRIFLAIRTVVKTQRDNLEHISIFTLNT